MAHQILSNSLCLGWAWEAVFPMSALQAKVADPCPLPTSGQQVGLCSRHTSALEAVCLKGTYFNNGPKLAPQLGPGVCLSWRCLLWGFRNTDAGVLVR